jgi:hypothetical protein
MKKHTTKAGKTVKAWARGSAPQAYNRVENHSYVLFGFQGSGNRWAASHG